MRTLRISSPLSSHNCESPAPVQPNESNGLAPPVAVELYHGNVHLLMAAAVFTVALLAVAEDRSKTDSFSDAGEYIKIARANAAIFRVEVKALSIPGLDQDSRVAINYELGSACETAQDRPAALRHFTEVYGANIDYRDVAERIQALKS